VEASLDELATAMSKHFMNGYARSREFENLVSQYANYRAQADSIIVLGTGRPRAIVEQLEQCVENLADYIHHAFINSNGHDYCDVASLMKQITTESLKKATLRKFLEHLINDGFLAYFLDLLSKKHFIFLKKYFNDATHVTLPDGEIIKIGDEQLRMLYDIYDEGKEEQHNELLGRCIKIIIMGMPELLSEDIIAGNKIEIVYGTLNVILKSHNLNVQRDIIINNVYAGDNVLISII